MNDLWKVIADLSFELHPERIEIIATKISTIKSSIDFEKIRDSFALGIQPKIIKEFHEKWITNTHITPLEIAAALRASSKTAELIQERESIQMVWSGPSTGFVATRDTQQVLLEVISSATIRLFLVSFVAYDIDIVIKALQNVISRNVEIHILLELPKIQGGKVNFDSIKIFKREIPDAKIYAWNFKDRTTGELDGAVHAKCAVADGKIAFITSANLTMAAMERNMELGVLIRGGNVPDMLQCHLDALIKTKIIEPV